MKSTVYLIVTSVVLVFGCFSCASTTPTDDTDSLIYLKVKSTQQAGKDSIAYLSTDFVWYNASTKELKFNNPPTFQKFQSFGQVKFYLGADSLFTAKIVTDAMSSIANDLVFHFKSDGKIYLEDGYPISQGDSTLRAQNKEKRAASWNRFVIKMKKDKHYVEN